MKLARFTTNGKTRLGIVEGEEIVDLAAASMPQDMVGFLAAGQSALDAAQAACASQPRIALAEVQLEAPVPNPPKYLAVGLNYRDHIAETGRDAPEFPLIFNKQTSCISGPFDPIHLPRASTALDYEGELAIVIGRECRHVPKERAAEVIAGYTVANDVSVRDWQRRAPTMTLGKSWDTHGPIGPWIVTADEVGDPHTLGIQTWVNGEERQNSNTKHLIHDCYTVIELLSTVFTLMPGDIIATGTPSGVGIGFDPARFLKAGDVVRIEVERIGTIENTVIDEPAETVRIV